MMFLAQAAPSLPDPNHFASIGWVIVILVAVVVGLNQVVSFWKDHMRERPTPSDTYVTIAQFERQMDQLSDELASDRAANKADHDGIFTKIGGHERGINNNLISIQTKVAALDERSETTKATLTLLDQKVDRIVERLKA